MISTFQRLGIFNIENMSVTIRLAKSTPTADLLSSHDCQKYKFSETLDVSDVPTSRVMNLNSNVEQALAHTN